MFRKYLPHPNNKQSITFNRMRFSTVKLTPFKKCFYTIFECCQAAKFYLNNIMHINNRVSCFFYKVLQ